MGKPPRKTAATPLRVTKITIRGLFRRYDHIIELRKDERVTILHGKNGVGKTLTLTLIDALCSGKYKPLCEIPFALVRIDFDDGSSFEVKREEKKGSAAADDSAAFEPDWPRRTVVERYAKRREERTDNEAAEELCLLNFVRRGKNGKRSVDSFPNASMSLVAGSQLDDVVRELRARVRIRFIETQRLLYIKEGDDDDDEQEELEYPVPKVIPVVILVAQDMAERIDMADARYRKIATQLDNSLPQRLFDPAQRPQVSNTELMGRYEALVKERTRLQAIGIFQDSGKPFDLKMLSSPSERGMFAVYLEDNEKKLKVFNQLAERAELLLQRMNKRLAPKRVILDKDNGYRVLSHDEQPIQLESLSSGEQHELVLLHTLLFQVRTGTLLLIDEPELSLHVIWQNELLDDLLDIAKLVGLDIILATHSPYIVGYHRELMVQLGGPE